MKYCLITGGSGSLGRALARQLVRLGCRVRSLDIIPDPFPVERVEFFPGDVRDPAAADRACAGADTVFHLAAVPPGEDPDLIRDVNIDGTANMLQAAELTGADTFVFASDCSVYGYPPPELPCPEDAPLVSSGPYTLSKIVAEEMCFEALERAGMKAAVVRAPVIIGAGFRNDFIMRFIVDRAMKNLPVFLPYGGSRRRHYVDGADCARALILAAERDEAMGRCFNVAFANPATDEQLARATIRSARSFSLPVNVPGAVTDAGLRVLKTAGGYPLPDELAPSLAAEYWYDTSLTRDLLGWTPSKTLSVSIHEFMKWHRRRQLREKT